MDLSAPPFLCLLCQFALMFVIHFYCQFRLQRRNILCRDRAILHFIASNDFRSHFLCLAILILSQGLFLLLSVLPKQEKWRPLMSFMYSVRPGDVDDDEHKH